MTWKFDANVAKTFVAHAKQHIPNYDTVIDKSVAVCRHLCDEDSAIIDVGCATGETIQRLYNTGFWKLYGVDSSADMLAMAPQIAQYTCSDQFPEGKFDAVLCNWTLHFIQDKLNYLRSIANGLNDNGFLILTDKTSLDDLDIHFYHKFKKAQGVTPAEISAKEESVKDIMFINDPEWYYENLRTAGFSEIHLIDASWCFTSFLCIK
jgi:SAM-dependent methyltransferase